MSEAEPKSEPTHVEKFATAVGRSLDQIKADYPEQFAEAERHLSCPLTSGWAIGKLEDDEGYQVLLRQTAAESSVAEILQTVAPMVMSLVFKLIAGAAI